VVIIESSYRRSRHNKSKVPIRNIIFGVLLLAVFILVVLSLVQYLSGRALHSEFDELKESVRQLEQENETLQRQHDEIMDENRTLREENHMLRSSKIITHGNRDSNKVALTIDDGGRSDLVESALQYLAEENTKATFFVLGTWLELEPEVWRRVVEEGHELGNHTYSHRYFSDMNDDEISTEMALWQELADKAIGRSYKTYFFRPPGLEGFHDAQSEERSHYLELIAEKGMFVTLWDVDHFYGLGGGNMPAERIAEYVLDEAQRGSIILLHCRENDLAALPSIIRGLRDEGLEPCSLSEMLLHGFAT
jgi:peptidoglycan-N-acetylglucosamine deacetylase